MKVKTSELDGLGLSWAVAYCEGFSPFSDGISWIIDAGGTFSPIPNYPSDWAQAGPIIERERVDVFYEKHTTGSWVGSMARGNKVGWRYLQYGSTPLIAAMRCYVASKMGDEVEIPNDLA